MKISRREMIQMAGAVTALELVGPAFPEDRLLREQEKNQVAVYPLPEGMTANTLFRIRVRSSGGEWQNVAPYSLQVSNVKLGRATLEETAVASFDFLGSVEVEITPLGGAVRDVRIRPLSVGMIPARSGDTLRFTLSAPRNLSIEINGDLFHNLQLFAGALESAPSRSSTPDLVHFAPGTHVLTPEQSRVKSGQTIYLAGGAVVHGGFLLEHVEDVRIFGRGLLHQPDGAIKVRFSRRIAIEGLVTTCNILVGQSEQVAIKNTKSIRSGKWGDGIDLFSSKGVTIEGAYLRTSDDCIAIYCHRWDYDGDTSDVHVSNCTLWADVAHPVLIGTHGNTEKPNTLEKILLENLDILEQHEEQIDYQGCIAINPGDNNLVRNVVVRNVRVEDFRMGQLVNLRVMFNQKYNTSPGRGIENVLFQNLSYTGSHANLSIVSGYDESRSIRNVRFENLTLNGTVIADNMKGKPAWYKTGDLAGMLIGEHVKDLTFVTVSPK